MKQSWQRDTESHPLITRQTFERVLVQSLVKTHLQTKSL